MHGFVRVTQFVPFYSILCLSDHVFNAEMIYPSNFVTLFLPQSLIVQHSNRPRVWTVNLTHCHFYLVNTEININNYFSFEYLWLRIVNCFRLHGFVFMYLCRIRPSIYYVVAINIRWGAVTKCWNVWLDPFVICCLCLVHVNVNLGAIERVQTKLKYV